MPPHRDGGGSCSRRNTRNVVSSAPASVQRNPPINMGGIDSKLTRIPKYVVPQMTHTAAHAK
jgi:hypothetical protein